MSPNKASSQQGRRYQFDVIVIGSGLAGLHYILELLKIAPHTKIALITKHHLEDSNSSYAQGGIAAISLFEDSVESHIHDTLKAGDGLSDIDAVKEIVTLGPSVIQQLIEFGVNFDRNQSGYDLAQEGGHSHRRIYHAGDITGKAITEALIKQVKTKKQITIFENYTTINLISQNKKHLPGSHPEILGAYILDNNKNNINTFLSKIVVLSTGGAGKVYRYTSNREFATGDGIAMAYRAGARVGNLEFYQFHPTLLYHTKINNFLISEALRGEGAYLLNADTQERFMQKYAPEKMELSTRDIVARAIFNEIENSKSNFVYLDIRHKDKTFLQKRFPIIYQTLFDLGIDMSQQLIPVVPAAHYLCGGILTDPAGKTDLHRLFAIGENAFTGLHGANRLASNSLLESTVMAFLAAQNTPALLKEPLEYTQPIQDWNSQSVVDQRRASQINAHWRGLRGEMTSYAGIIRTAAGLQDVLRLITARKEMIENYYWKHFITSDLVELRNIVLVAELIVRSALHRRESRGVHFREDYPNKMTDIKESFLHINDA